MARSASDATGGALRWKRRRNRLCLGSTSSRWGTTGNKITQEQTVDLDEKLDLARRELRQQLREFIGDGESWPDQFWPLASAIEELIELKIEQAKVLG